MEEATLRPLSGPLDLCRTLGLRPSELQSELLADSGGLAGVADWRMEPPEVVLRAAGMLVLWRVLRQQGSRAIVLAPGTVHETHDGGRVARCGSLGRELMDFLQRACVLQDPALASVTRRPAWNRLEFGAEAGWEIRLVPNLPRIVAEAAPRSAVGLVLDAGSADPDLFEARAALEGGIGGPPCLLLRLW